MVYLSVSVWEDSELTLKGHHGLSAGRTWQDRVEFWQILLFLSTLGINKEIRGPD